MKAIKSLLFGLLTLGTVVARSAEEPATLLGQAGSASFTMEVPAGWVASRPGGQHQAGDLLFELEPASSERRAKVIVVYYPGKVPIVAQRYMEGLTYDGNVELPRIEGLSNWAIFGSGGKHDGRFGAAYSQVGEGTLVVELSRRAGDSYNYGEQTVLSLLRSFKEFKKLP